MNRLRHYARALTIILFVLGQLLLVATIVLWFLADIGRLPFAGLEPISVLVATVLSYLGALAVWLANNRETREERDQAQELRNRKQLIQNVKATWIEGVRNQALHNSVWILTLTLVLYGDQSKGGSCR